MLHTRFCRIEFTVWGAVTRFEDGTESANWPPQDGKFLEVVGACAFTDPVRYIQHHDLAHTFLSEKLFGEPSPTLWEAAHGRVGPNLYEERAVYHFQRYLRQVDFSQAEYARADWLEEFDLLFQEAEKECVY